MGPYSRSQFISVGADDGVKRDMAVLSGEGLVGRVQEVTGGNARVMLITDISSRIAVVTQNGRENAMVVGRNGELLELRYLPKKTKVKLGEMVMTSGDADLMPSGIPLGKVVKVTPQEVLVKPVVDWSRLSFVSVVAPE
jgi:rod shape-determining protein MreC